MATSIMIRKDGNIKIRFTLNEKETFVIDYYRKSLKVLTNKLPRTYSAKSVKILELNSKKFSNFISEYLHWEGKKGRTVGLRNKNLLKDKKFIRGFLRGLTDLDGYVRKGRKEIYFGSTSHNLFNDFLQGLNLFELEHKTISSKESWLFRF